MRQKSVGSKEATDKLVKNIRRKTVRKYSAEEKIRIVLECLRGEESIAALCRREGIAESLHYKWSKEFLEAGKRQLSGDTARQATAPEVKELRSEASALKECVAATGSSALLDNLDRSKQGRWSYFKAAPPPLSSDLHSHQCIFVWSIYANAPQVLQASAHLLPYWLVV